MNFVDLAQLLGNLGEFVGSFAVVVTLIYFAIQIRNTHRESQTAALQQRGNQVLGIYGAATTSDSLAEALSLAESYYGPDEGPMQSFRDCLVTDAGLDEKQARQVGTHYGLIWNTYLTSHVVSEGTERSLNDSMILGRLRTGLGRLFYQHMNQVMPLEFRQHVDQLIKLDENAIKQRA